MIGQPTSLDIALAFTKAWTSHDMDAAATYVDDDVVFDGPSNGAKSYLDALTKLAGSVKVLKMIGVYGKDDQALLMYDLHTRQEDTLTCVKCLTVRGGKIVSDRLTLDSFKLRYAQGANA